MARVVFQRPTLLMQVTTAQRSMAPSFCNVRRYSKYISD